MLLTFNGVLRFMWEGVLMSLAALFHFAVPLLECRLIFYANLYNIGSKPRSEINIPFFIVLPVRPSI